MRTPLTTRRTFLKAASAAAAWSCLGPGALLAAQDRPRPSQRIALGFIGVGNMGGGHVGSFLRHSDVQVVAVCDVDHDKREKARTRVEEHYDDPGSCFVTGRFEEILARDDIDAVVIAVPDHWHAIIAVAACQAGKDVYCEKPLSLTVREAEAMVAAARRHGRVFQTGSQQRSSDNFRFACELVRNGRIGEVQTVHVGIGDTSVLKEFPEEPVPEGLDWERWLGPAPWAPYHPERCSGSYSGGWRMIREYSGGMTTDWGAHHFDIAQWGLGMDGSGPVEIHPPGDDPDSLLTFVYESGVKMFRGGANGVLFTGTEGKVEVNRGYLRTWPESLADTRIAPSEIHLRRSPGHARDWLDGIRSRRRPLCDVAIGASSVTVCHLANIALWTGRSIRWDPVRREIVGDPLAARWLDRPRRGEWRIDGVRAGGLG